MLRYMIVETLYVVYLTGFLLICVHHLSVAVFGHTKRYDKERSLLSGVLLALIWPLALFSRDGRNELKHKFVNFI